MIMVLQIIICFEKNNNNINIKEISFKCNKLISDSQYFSFLLIKLKFEKCLYTYIFFQ